MLSIQGTGRVKKIAFRTESGEVIRKVPGLLAARKHVINADGWKKIKSVPNLFCFVSSPKIYKQDMIRKLSKGWCHPFKGKEVLPDNIPEILLPESDFLDSSIVYYKKNDIKYDYFYFTLNSEGGVKNKGLYEFIKILPILGHNKLKGKVIVYFPNIPKYKKFIVRLDRTQKEILHKYSKYIDFHWGFLDTKSVNDLMTSCRFGLFPNTVDNSPRLISESLIRNVPILVNNKIHGGWHYVNNDTGRLFTHDNLQESIEYMMTNKFNSRDDYHMRYGFEKSSKRLANFLKLIFGYDDVTHAYFSDFHKYLGNIHD